MNDPCYIRIDWSQFDAFQGDAPEITFPYLIDCLRSGSLDTAMHGHAGIVQWPYENVQHVGRIGAVPLMIDCIADLLNTDSVLLPHVGISALRHLREGVADYVFLKRYYSGSRISLWGKVSVATLNSTSSLMRQLRSSLAEARREAVKALRYCDREQLRPMIVERLSEETDDNVQQELIESLGSMMCDDQQQRLIASSQSPHSGLRFTATKVLALRAGWAPNPWLTQLCDESIKKNERTWSADRDAMKVIESLNQESWAFALAYWMDLAEALTGGNLIAYVHSFVWSLFSWHRERGFYSLVDGEMPNLFYTTLAFLVHLDAYWIACDAAADRDRKRILTSEFNIPCDRDTLWVISGDVW